MSHQPNRQPWRNLHQHQLLRRNYQEYVLSDRAAATMVVLALRAVTLRLHELEAALLQAAPDTKRQLVARIDQFRNKQQELESRLAHLHTEAQCPDGAVQIYSAVHDILEFME